MTKKQMIVAAPAMTLLAAIPVILYAGIAGADAGYSGSTGEQNCSACHDSGSGGGSVSVAFPNGMFYTAGTKQHWVVTVADLAGHSWGFQLSTRQKGTSTQAGTYQPGGEGFTQVVCGNTLPTLTKESFLTAPSGGPCPTGLPLQWIEQTWKPSNPIGSPLLGARFNLASQSVTFEFDWNPPSSTVGDIDVNVAAVAGNGTDSTFGGHVYTKHYTLSVPSPNQPAVTLGGVVNGASYQTTIGPNTWVTIQGTNLANSTRSWGQSDFVNGNLPTSLDGVSVTIGGVAAYVEYISPTQVNVLTPSPLPAGPNMNVQLVNNTLNSFPGTVTSQAYAPALFEWNGKYAVATNPDFSYVGPPGLFPNATTTPAKAGNTIILWATGLGLTNPLVTSGAFTPSNGTTYNVTHPPTVTIGGVGAQVVGAALAPGYAGLYQIAIVVPSGLSNGDQPITLQSGSYSSPSTGVFLTIGN